MLILLRWCSITLFWRPMVLDPPSVLKDSRAVPISTGAGPAADWRIIPGFTGWRSASASMLPVPQRALLQRCVDPLFGIPLELFSPSAAAPAPSPPVVAGGDSPHCGQRHYDLRYVRVWSPFTLPPADFFGYRSLAPVHKTLRSSCRRSPASAFIDCGHSHCPAAAAPAA